MAEEKKQPFNVFIPEGEGSKAEFHKVGVAWPIKDGGFSVDLIAGVSITARRLVILPRKEKNTSGADE